MPGVFIHHRYWHQHLWWKCFGWSSGLNHAAWAGMASLQLLCFVALFCEEKPRQVGKVGKDCFPLFHLSSQFILHDWSCYTRTLAASPVRSPASCTVYGDLSQWLKVASEAPKRIGVGRCQLWGNLSKLFNHSKSFSLKGSSNIKQLSNSQVGFSNEFHWKAYI